jgi:hypothetical protein
MIRVMIKLINDRSCEVSVPITKTTLEQYLNYEIHRYLSVITEF